MQIYSSTHFAFLVNPLQRTEQAHNQFSAPHKHAINIHVNTLTNMLNIIYMCAGIVSVGRTDGTAHIASHRD